jgi:carboxylesterase
VAAALRAVTSTRRDAAVLLLHGLTGTAIDVETVARALAEDGYTTSTPLLPGRGTNVAEMDRLSWEDWMAPVLAEYDDLARTHDQVVVGGLSAGATMALDVALRRRPAALLLYATALGTADRLAALAPYLWRLIPRWPCAPSDRVDLTIDSPCYDPMPLRAVGEVISAIRRLRPRISDITAPSLVAHAIADRVVPIAYARDLASRLSGPVQTLFLEGSGHSITIDARRDEVADATRAFLDETLAVRRLRSA